AATVVCHPSVAEGFGIPFLEGMGYGAPVVAADIPPVREIGAGAAELVPPSDPGALAEALSALLADETARQDLARRGYARAQTYTWEAMADRVVDAYRLVLT
ncbi:MAG TPA: glycosyltransferase, partial [Acidimicrobiales bacterium]